MLETKKKKKEIIPHKIIINSKDTVPNFFNYIGSV